MVIARRCHVESHGALTSRPVSRQSPEQLACGVWWDCAAPGCGTSVLDPSPALAAQLALQTARLARQAHDYIVGGERGHCARCGVRKKHHGVTVEAQAVGQEGRWPSTSGELWESLW